MDCLQHAFHINGKGKATALPTQNLPSLPKKGEGYLWLHFKRKTKRRNKGILRMTLT